MTYSSGGLIQATDYNGFVNDTAGANINATWNTAYGQTALSTVTGGTSTVTAPQWATLVNTLTSLGTHTNTTITARSAPTAGQTIGILSAVNTDITSVYNNRYNAYASGTQYTAWTGTNSKTTQTGTSGGAAWTITFTNTVTWTSAAAAQYFFNAGGLIKIQVAKSSTGLTGDPAWNDLAGTLCGAIYISGLATAHTIAGTSYTGTTKIGGTGTPNTLSTGTGWDALTTGAAATIVYKQFSATAPYTGDYIQHTIAKATSSTQLVISTTWVATDTNVPPVGGTDPISGGTAASGATPGTAPCTIVTYFPPETTNLTNTWGTPTVAATTA
jgi:hypothetical protein